jgi:hypothetical protein
MFTMWCRDYKRARSWHHLVSLAVAVARLADPCSWSPEAAAADYASGKQPPVPQALSVSIHQVRTQYWPRMQTKATQNNIWSVAH